MPRFTRGYLARVPTVERTLACKLGMHGACERIGCQCMHHYAADRQGARAAMARVYGRDGYAATEGKATRGL